MTELELEKLVEWLGPDGAIAGLESSHLTNSDLYDLAIHCGLSLDRKTRRSDIVNELVNWRVVRIEKPADELLTTNYEDLKAYFLAKRVSRTELLRILSKFDIQPKSEEMKNLIDFAAREISDLGMYERVAKGRTGGH